MNESEYEMFQQNFAPSCTLVVSYVSSCTRRRRCFPCCTTKRGRTSCQADIHSHRTSVTILLVYKSSSQPKKRCEWQNPLKILRNILGTCIA